MSAWSDPASFETGLLSTADWGDAKWIGKSAHRGGPLARLHRRLRFSIDEPGSAVFFGSRDVHNGYMWQISVAGRHAAVPPALRPTAPTSW